MPIDPYAALNAMIRAEVARTDPAVHGAPGSAAPEPEPPEPAEADDRPERGTDRAR
ncbi:hypothetical protein ACWGI8_34830 [Streptomyces sp. NPDC054841]